MKKFNLLGYRQELFLHDLKEAQDKLLYAFNNARCLVIGAAGTIGQSVTKEILNWNPKVLHAVDVSENNMAELVRDIRSTIGYTECDFQTFAIDCSGVEFKALMQAEQGYDYVFNLSALKLVRSEKDPYTLMRMVRVNILNTIETINNTSQSGLKKYFCVSTDKATNPINMMGASKKIMEMFLMRESIKQPISTARFANVAFSDGSLLHGFRQRFEKKQPLSAPFDVRRYFISQEEAGKLCVMSGALGENRDIFFPRIENDKNLLRFSDIACDFLRFHNFEPYECESEDEARIRVDELIARRMWPVYFFRSDTTGEKDVEEFFTNEETLDLKSYKEIGIIKNEGLFDPQKLKNFEDIIASLLTLNTWSKQDLIDLFMNTLIEFDYTDLGKYLDSKM